MYRILTTKHYVVTHKMDRNIDRSEVVTRDDCRTWCTRCDWSQHEDILHMLWACLELQDVWSWAQKLLQLANEDQYRGFQLTPTQALLSAKLVNVHRFMPWMF